VDGDSMVDAGLAEGALVVVRSTQEATSGDICAVWIDGDGGTLKTVQFEGDTVRLIPQNSNYTPMQYPAERVRIQGVVVAVLDMRRV
jgi:repressor LexA